MMHITVLEGFKRHVEYEFGSKREMEDFLLKSSVGRNKFYVVNNLFENIVKSLAEKK